MKTTRHNAIAECLDCGKILYSSGGGRTDSYPCGNLLDQERWSGLYVRGVGNIKGIEVICPENCEHREDHKNNKQIKDFNELKKYLKDNYGGKIK